MSHRVWNKKTEKPPKDAVFIGRPSKWGNPFSAAYESQRDWAVNSFTEWLEKNPKIKEQIRQELKGRDLVCYCKPKRCHGDVIFKIANEDYIDETP